MKTKKIILLLSIMILQFFSHIDCMQQRKKSPKDNQLTARQINNKEKRKHRRQQEKDYLKQVEKNETACDPLCCLICPIANCGVFVVMGLLGCAEYLQTNDITNNLFNGTQS